MTIFEFFKALLICLSIVIPLTVLISCLACIQVEDDMDIIKVMKLIIKEMKSIIKWAKEDLRKMINKK